ncbi:hypothetical protein KHHGKMAE_2389 [Methylobacterium persicinum]|nr:hypothetical protein KHHGKMAE_2389 [Methylobacterium persicinum]
MLAARIQAPSASLRPRCRWISSIRLAPSARTSSLIGAPATTGASWRVSPLSTSFAPAAHVASTSAARSRVPIMPASSAITVARGPSAISPLSIRLRNPVTARAIASAVSVSVRITSTAFHDGAITHTSPPLARTASATLAIAYDLPEPALPSTTLSPSRFSACRTAARCSARRLGRSASTRVTTASGTKSRSSCLA